MSRSCREGCIRSSWLGVDRRGCKNANGHDNLKSTDCRSWSASDLHVRVSCLSLSSRAYDSLPAPALVLSRFYSRPSSLCSDAAAYDKRSVSHEHRKLARGLGDDRPSLPLGSSTDACSQRGFRGFCHCEG